jgi:hypothetical protein
MSPNNEIINNTNKTNQFTSSRNFSKRCLFDLSEHERGVHIRTLSTLTNEYLLPKDIKFPQEDNIFRDIGAKRLVQNKRNMLTEYSPGDKSYKAVEYSPNFYDRKSRESRYQDIRREREDELLKAENLFEMLNVKDREISLNLFSNDSSFGYEQDARSIKIEEIREVENLDNWVHTDPPIMPFKVLDLADKTIKYRPKVNR